MDFLFEHEHGFTIVNKSIENEPFEEERIIQNTHTKSPKSEIKS